MYCISFRRRSVADVKIPLAIISRLILPNQSAVWNVNRTEYSGDLFS